MGALGSRVRLAVKALVGLYSDRALTEAYGLLAGMHPVVGAPPVRGTRQMLEAYSTMPWLRAVAAKVSAAVAATEWELYAPPGGRRRDALVQRATFPSRGAVIREAVASDTLRRVESHLLLDTLHAANSFLVGPALLRVTQIHLDLVGEAFWIKDRNALGAPIGFWPIPPDWVQETATPRHRFHKVGFAGWRGEIPDTEVLWMVDPDPANPYGRGSGLARTLADELETDEYAARHAKMVFLNRARPDLIIWPEETKHDAGTIGRQEAERLAERWRAEHQGFWRAALPYFATRKIGVHVIDQDFQQLQLTELRRFERDTIIQAFTMPPEEMGIIENSNRSTIDSADYLFKKNIVVPRVEFLRAYLQERLVPEYDERLVLHYRSPVEEDRAAQRAAATVAPWALRVDEWRAMQGVPPLEDGKGKVFIMPTNVVPVADPTVPPPSPFALGAPGGREPVRRSASPEAWDEVRKACLEAGDADGVRAAEAELADDPDELPELSRRLTRRERAAAREVLAQLAGLEEQTPSALETALAVRETEAAVAAVPVEAWGRVFEVPVRELAEAAFMVGAEHGAEQAGLTIERAADSRVPWNVVNPEAVAWARAHAAELIRAQINPANLEGVRAAVVQALRAGWGAEKTARLVRASIGLTARQATAVAAFAERLSGGGLAEAAQAARVARYAKAQRKLRSVTIARQELMTAGNTGQQRLWQLAEARGVLDTSRLVRRWMVARIGEWPCELCEALADTTSPVGGTFAGGIAQPPRHVRCRCTTGLVRAETAQPAAQIPGAVPTEGPAASAFRQQASDELARLKGYRGLRRLSVRELRITEARTLDQLGKRSAGAVGLHEETAKRLSIALHSGAGEDALAFGGFRVNGSLQGTLRHELGHAAEQAVTAAQRREWLNLWRQYGTSMARSVSQYAATNPEEFFAEAFSAYTHPRYAGGLPGPVEAFFKKTLTGGKEFDPDAE